MQLVASARGARGGSSAPPQAPAGRSTYGLALLFLSPWIVGFLLFLLYPMVASLYFSFTQLRPADLAALDRARELPLHAQRRTRSSGRRSATRLWMVVIGAAAAALLRAPHGDAADRSACAASASTARSTTCRRWCRRSRRALAFIVPPEPRPRARQRAARAPRHRRRRCGSSTRLAKPAPRAARPVGRRRRDDHLPRRPARRAAARSSRRPASTAPTRCAATGT